jgi:hypothetical protein
MEYPRAFCEWRTQRHRRECRVSERFAKIRRRVTHLRTALTGKATLAIHLLGLSAACDSFTGTQRRRFPRWTSYQRCGSQARPYPPYRADTV